MAHGNVHFLTSEVDVMHGGRNAQVDIRVRIGKPAEPVHQPFCGEVRRRADCEDARALPLHQTIGAERDTVECIAQHPQVFAARLGDDQPLALMVEELDAEFRLESLDLMAHRSLHNAKFVGGAGEVFVPGRSLEGLEGVGRRRRSIAVQHEKN
jgi:hypothetical protein